MNQADKARLEGILRVVVAMQSLCDALLAQGQLMLDPHGTADAPPEEDGQSAGHDNHATDDPLNPRRFGQEKPRAQVPD